MKFKKGDVVDYLGAGDYWVENFTQSPYVVIGPYGYNLMEVAPLNQPFKYPKGHGHKKLGIYRLNVSDFRLNVFLTAARKAVHGHQKKRALHRKRKAS